MIIIAKNNKYLIFRKKKINYVSDYIFKLILHLSFKIIKIEIYYIANRFYFNIIKILKY